MRRSRARRPRATAPQDHTTVYEPPELQEQYSQYAPDEPHPQYERPEPAPPPPPRARGKRSRRPGALPPVAYFGAAGVIVIVAALVVGVLVVLTREEHHSTAPAIRVPAAGIVPTAYSSARSGSVFAPISTRTHDPQPLTAEEAFKPKSISDEDSKAELKLTESKIDMQCASAVWGERLAQELRQAGCTQVTRGVYGDKKFTIMVTIFNLADVRGADRLVTAATPASGAGFPVPLAADRFGRSFSTARGVAMGHYAVITWVQRADGTGDEQDKDLLSLLVTTSRPEAVLTRAIRGD